MGDIAFAAGFASIRQFNATILEVYDTAPRALRERAVARDRAGRAGRAGGAGRAGNSGNSGNSGLGAGRRLVLSAAAGTARTGGDGGNSGTGGDGGAAGVLRLRLALPAPHRPGRGVAFPPP